MPPLFRKNASRKADSNKIKKTSATNYLNKKPLIPFKTPLLSKFRLANFLKPNSEEETPNESTSADSGIDSINTEDNTVVPINLDKNSYIKTDSVNTDTRDNTLPADPQATSETMAISIDTGNSKISSEKDDDASNNQIVPSLSLISNTEPIVSPDIFETSGFTGQLAMNDPAIKGAYLDFLGKKNTFGSQISSQSSNYSINDPEIKKMYLDFMKSKADTEKINKVHQSNKCKRRGQKKTNKNSKKNIDLPEEKTKRSNKSRQSNKRKEDMVQSTVDEHNRQKKPNTEVKNKKHNKSKVTSISHIDIKFSKTASASTNSKNTKSHKKTHKQDRQSKEIVSGKEPTKNPTQTESSKVIRSTQTFQSQKEKLDSVLEACNTGVYVICDRCEKTRYLEDVLDPLELPEKWYCENNPDPSENACIVPQRKISDDVEAKLITNLYNAGSIVWARLQGYPWWPAMVDVCPDVEDFFWLDNLEDQVPTWYNVTYFDTATVTRSWLKVANIAPFQKNSHQNKPYIAPRDMSHRLEKSIRMAQEALDLPLMERLQQYSFIYRYNKPINKPIIGTKPKNETQAKHINKKSSHDKKKRVKQIVRRKSDDSDATTLSNIFEFDIEPDIAVQELF